MQARAWMIHASLQLYPIRHLAAHVEGGGEGVEHLETIQQTELIKKIIKSGEAALHH